MFPGKRSSNTTTRVLTTCQTTRNLEGDFISLTEQCYEAITTSIMTLSCKERRSKRKHSDLSEVVQLGSENAGTGMPAGLESFVLMSSRIHWLRDQVSHSPPERG